MCASSTAAGVFDLPFPMTMRHFATRAWLPGILLALAPIGSAAAQLRAGAATVSITPSGAAWLAGYSGRSHPCETPGGPSETPGGDIRARALAIDDGAGGRAVLISVELLALPRTLTEMTAADIMKRLGLERGQILINATGTHSAPFVLGLQPGLAPDLAPDDVEERRKIAAYSSKLSHGVSDLAAEAFSKMQPARMGFAFGHASFAVNTPLRTRIHADVPNGRAGTAVPVLRVETTAGRTMAVVFGYACRAAVLDAGSYILSGDYPGVASARIERDFPGAVALFVRLCDGDQSPSPRGSADLATLHGEALASVVARTLASPLRAVNGPLRATLIETSLAFAPQTRAQLERESRDADPVRARWARRLIAAYDARNELRSMPYPVQVIRLRKSFALVALSGEPALSYDERVRAMIGLGDVIVAGGTGGAGYYIPGAETANTGVADPADSIVYSGLPGAFTAEAEERILGTVEKAWKRVLK
jgi:neutral ceramidase